MTSTDRIARLRISLAEIEPEIWRRVEVPLAVHLKGVHDVIQAAMGWEDYHLFEFHIGQKVYGIPDPAWDFDREVMNARSVRLAALIARGIDHLEYVYDLGDNWRHVVTIEAVGPPPAPARLYPRFVEGARRCPPEDVGGVIGYDEFLEAVRKPRHPEQRRILEWYGGPYDPDDIDLALIRRRIGQLANRRAAGQAAYAKSRRKG
jgi:hypothetical protein